MKVRVTLKDPDSMSDAVDEATKREAITIGGLNDREREEIAQGRADTARDAISHRWMKWSEYLVVEFDTELMTATVLTNKESGM